VYPLCHRYLCCCCICNKLHIVSRGSIHRLNWRDFLRELCYRHIF